MHVRYFCHYGQEEPLMKLVLRCATVNLAAKSFGLWRRLMQPCGWCQRVAVYPKAEGRSARCAGAWTLKPLSKMRKRLDRASRLFPSNAPQGAPCP